eukprot:CAMPEP_0202942262 /NCGR_PEP_ID=MMETSP1395-20130829/2414_1 /ASSEMBLY_ACC=CAM_ASM_000871 /TAXON_ID=5961 /ORGANISM="Blepharisma japonicum, Strain Stock R1072" /LENGTH=659 /DNA_ID=CAMNT_0049638279 /DNA_START=98 /DNA_END=2077 /DNA_ORIENTATION=-
MMSASLTIKNSLIYIKNEDYDPEQEQAEFLSFPIDQAMQLTHFTVLDDEDQIEAVKWINLATNPTETAPFIGFEFEEPNSYALFQQNIEKMIQVDEEGLQHPESREGNLKEMQSKLNATSQKTSYSKINIKQVQPAVENAEEEKEIGKILDFKRAVIEHLRNLFTPDQIIYTSPGDLYFHDPNKELPVLMERGIGFLIVKHGPFQYTVDLVKDGEVIMRNLLTKNLSHHIDVNAHSVSWIEVLDVNLTRYWTMILLDDMTHLEELFLVAQFESSRQISVDTDLTQEDKAWIKGEESSEVENTESSEGESEKVEIEYADEIKMEEDTSEDILDSATSYCNPWVFTAKQNKIGLYRLDEDNLHLSQNIPIVSTYEDGFNASRILPYKQDSRLLMLSQKDPSIIYNMDLNRGEIVEQYNVKGNASIADIAPHQKLSPMTVDNLFYALSKNGLFTIDPRVSGHDKSVESKIYSSRPNLTCMASTEQGYVAAGSATGEIRMYKQVGQNSKTNMPGFGDPITSIDITKDGSWILATTDTYLIAIPANSHGENGFVKPLGKHKRKPRKLALKPADIAKFNLTDIKFTPARFNLGENSKENAIITSTGNYVVIWSFSAIKKGRLESYKIKPLTESVIKNEFKFNEENAWITHPNSLHYQKNHFKFHE